MHFETELKKIGLNDKEASVYVASLQLGPSPAQQIARKAKVVRATTYVVLDSLMQRGLITQYKEGKKTLFSAEPPRQLMRLLERHMDEVREQQHDLERLLPELQVLMKSAGNRPSVRYFEGKEGLRAIRSEFLMYAQPGDMIYSFTPADHLNAVFPDDADTFYPQRIARKIRARVIFTTRSASLKQSWLSSSSDMFSERIYIPPERFPSASGMTVYRDRIAIGTYTGKQIGVVIESEPMADMMKRLFELSWFCAPFISGAETSFRDGRSEKEALVAKS